MPLTHDQIAAIAQWDPVQTGFGRDDPQTRPRIQNIVDLLNATPDVGCELLRDDGLSNYFALFSYTKADVRDVPFPHCQGLLIYLSACASIGVAGKSSKCVGPGFITHEHLKPDLLLNPRVAQTRLEEATIAIIRQEGYDLLPPDEVARSIPPGIEVWSESNVFWALEQVFDVLFLETD